jgi:hypothetical protein
MSYSFLDLAYDVLKQAIQNRDFDKFLQDVKIDNESKRIHRAEFDDVSKDIAKYIKDKMKIEQGCGAYR